MCCNTNRCCLGSPATQVGLLQAQIANTQAVFKKFQMPVAPPAFTAPLAFFPVGVNLWSIPRIW